MVILRKSDKEEVRRLKDVHVIYILPQVDEMSDKEYIDHANIDRDAALNLDIAGTVEIKYSVADLQPNDLRLSMSMELPTDEAEKLSFKVPVNTEATAKENLVYQLRGKSLKKHELKRFLGILFLSGCHFLPQWKLYWSNSPDFGIPIVNKTMPRSRFESLERFFHLANNNDLDRNDRFTKLRPLIDAYKKEFRSEITTTFLLAEEQLDDNGDISNDDSED
ncbi:hypothetical protein ILUMI_00758 [Ignelater luminosus]|uniref:PiggyBac transposable element-derived protein domain-containing protein n=1 Tax=Ignelater luminosus TaxID=2038154 RepID=A0A8K0DJS6_IGNLU|nr:hypothetical protein ILUMI_00758 [Ignelater luminosus]